MKSICVTVSQLQALNLSESADQGLFDLAFMGMQLKCLKGYQLENQIVTILMKKTFDELMTSGDSADLQRLAPDKWIEKCREEGIVLK